MSHAARAPLHEDEAAALLAARRGRPAAPRAGHTVDQLAERRGRPAVQPPPAVGAVVARTLQPVLPDEGLTLAALQRRWGEIVGDKLALLTAPEKLSGSKDAMALTVRCVSSAAPFVQHQIPLILERCALAGRPLARVAIVQGPLPKRTLSNVRPLTKTLAADIERRLALGLASIDDPGLKSALLRLGRTLAVRGDV